MSDKFAPLPFRTLFELTLQHINSNAYFGLPSELFLDAQKFEHLNTEKFGQKLDNPIGVAAGPHTQLAQNIIAAWLCGARFIELKTVQTLDHLEISKPCIDIQDEGYNCEWSQELTIQQSFDEYLNAWIILHFLNFKLYGKTTLQTIFNMSIGYNLEGILKENVQWFIAKMLDCRAELAQKCDEIKDLFPQINSINIPTKISDNVTLSTMHGCPPNEIFEIANYLISKRKLQTIVKLNPTLLGKEKVREILNSTSNFDAFVPDIAFEHDLKWDAALELIESLQKIAVENSVYFGVKLSNTLEVVNFKQIFDPQNEFMYLSGRALHPITINLAAKLQAYFEGKLDISFSAGADCFNVADLIMCGFSPITVCSDLLKPGGYGRLHQYFDEIDKAKSIKIATNTAISFDHLVKYSSEVLQSQHYRKEYFATPSIKTSRKLEYFDCIAAPCISNCATEQLIPNYLRGIATSNSDEALFNILQNNPLPAITGMICDHLCQLKCTRLNYDKSLNIREIKRFASENSEVKLILNQPKSNKKVAIIGAGPAGLSCAYYLALSGFCVEIFDDSEIGGGMVQKVIPSFRLTNQAVQRDIKRITDLGVIFHYSTEINSLKFNELKSNFNHIFIAIGAHKSVKLNIENINTKNVLDPLQFLAEVKAGKKIEIGKKIGVIGGGNSAMDAARVAKRLAGEGAEVTIIYRRTRKEMPADLGEIKAALADGVKILELVAPECGILKFNLTIGLLCSKMKLTTADDSGRLQFEKIPNSEFKIYFDTLIPAIGQQVEANFSEVPFKTSNPRSLQTQFENIYIGGDAFRGGATAIKAIADGRQVAKQICEKEQINWLFDVQNTAKSSKKDLMLKRFKRDYGQISVVENAEINPFEIETKTLSNTDAIAEAKRCLDCDEICNICTTVCPNLANFSYTVTPQKYHPNLLIWKNSKWEVIPDQVFEIQQSTQIINIGDWCNACGNCATFCPTHSAPYLDKPVIYFKKPTFDANENYFHFEIGSKTLVQQKNGIISSLTLFENAYLYKYFNININYDLEFRIIDVSGGSEIEVQVSSREAIRLSLILSGINQFFKP